MRRSMTRPCRRALASATALLIGAGTVTLAPATAGAAGPDAVVDAGAVRAVVSEQPWRLELVDQAGDSVLREADGAGPSGPLGFQTAAGWQHATRVLSSARTAGGYEAVVATTDPLRRLEVRLAAGSEGVIELDAQVTGPTTADLLAVGMGFEAAGDERFLGFGERSNRVEHRGATVENYVSDGPYQAEEYPFLNAFVPPWGLREREDATYFPVPWLLSSRGYGVLVDNPQTSYFRLGTDDPSAWSAQVTAAPLGEVGALPAPAPDRLRLRFFGGDEPSDALRRFTRETGRQPTPEPWTFGPWFQATGDEQAQLRGLRAADVPVSVLQTYLHYLPCGDQQGIEAEQPARTAAAHAAGVAVTTYVNPMVCSDYAPAFQRAAAAGALTKDRTGRPYLYRYGASPQDSNLVGQYDFFTDAGREAYGDVLDEAIAHGYDGWMEDFGEYTPLDSVSGDGIDGTAAHNPYVTEYHCAAYEQAAERSPSIVRYQRSGWTGAARCADVVWGGDPTTGWGFDGLRSSVRQGLSMGMSGVGVWGSDIGGFFALGLNERTPELLTRWVQLGAFSPVMRAQAGGVALPDKPRPQVHDPDQLANWRRYSKLHTQLHPYLVAAQEEYARTGMPIMRHHALSHPDDAASSARDDQFMLGPDLLAAPVLDPGVRERELHLPAGDWVDLWRAVRYDPRSGGLVLGSAQPLPGGRLVTVPAPLEELPVLVRAGAVLPLLDPDVDTLFEHGDDPATVRASERSDRLQLLAFPRGDSESSLPGGGRLVSDEQDGAWSLQVVDGRSRTYALQASMSTLGQPFQPCRLTLDGRAVPRGDWAYDAASQALTATLTVQSGTLEVRACRPAALGRHDDTAAAARALPSTGGAPATTAVAAALALAGLALVRRRPHRVVAASA